MPTQDDSRSEAWLALYTQDLDPDALTARIGIAPDAAAAKGSLSGRRPLPHHHWSLGSEGRVPRDAHADAHLREVLDRIEPHAERLPPAADCTPRMWVYWTQDVPYDRFLVPPETLARIAALEADLSVSVIVLPEEDLYVDADEDVIEAAGRPEGGGDVLVSGGEVDSRRHDDHVAWLARAAGTTPLERVWLTWILARDESTIQLAPRTVATLAGFGAPVVFRIGLR